MKRTASLGLSFASKGLTLRRSVPRAQPADCKVPVSRHPDISPVRRGHVDRIVLGRSAYAIVRRSGRCVWAYERSGARKITRGIRLTRARPESQVRLESH